MFVWVFCVWVWVFCERFFLCVRALVFVFCVDFASFLVDILLLFYFIIFFFLFIIIIFFLC